MRARGILGSTMAVVMAVSSIAVSPAAAAPIGTDNTVTVNEAAAALADVAALTGPSASTTATPDGFITRSGGTVVELPSDPADGLSLTTAGGPAIEIGLPGAANADDGVRQESGEVVYADALPDVAMAAQAKPDGGLRALVVIDGPEAPPEFRFPMTLPSGASLVPSPDGGVSIIGSDREPIGQFAAPWAYDANGTAVPTSYRVEGTTLVQTVSHAGAVYPVVADPDYFQDCGWVTCTRWTSVYATKFIYDNRFNSQNAYWAMFGLVKCGAAGIITAGSLGLACGAWEARLVLDMNRAFENAVLNKGCVKWKWSRQFGQGWTTDWDWTTPTRTSKCAKS